MKWKDVTGHPAVIVAALYAWLLGWRMLLVGPVPSWRMWVSGTCVGIIIAVLIMIERWNDYEGKSLKNTE